MATDVLGYLQSKGLDLKSAPSLNVHTRCFFCQEAKAKGRLYVNVDPEGDPPGLFYCHLCGRKGALKAIKKFFGDPVNDDDAPEDQSYINYDIWQEAASYYHERLDDHPEVVRWLVRERGLEPETIAQLQVGWADGGLRKHLRSKGYTMEQIQTTGLVDHLGADFFDGIVTIPYHTNGNVVTIRGKMIGGKYLGVKGTRVRLFNSDVTFGNTQTLFVCEGELDAALLNQYGFPAVGVPGANTWLDNWTDYLVDMKRVYIVYDNDAAGIAGGEKLATLLGGRARVVKMPTENGKKIDVTDFFVKQGRQKEDFNLLVSAAKGGLLVTVDEAFKEWQDQQGVEGLKFGYTVLDEYLYPGLLPGQVCIILAKTNAGKTLALLNVFERILYRQPTKKVLFFSLEQTRGDWWERARRIHRFYNLDVSDRETLEYYRERILLVDKNRVSADEMMGAVDQFKYEMGQVPDLIAIDYLGYFARSFKGEPYQRTTDAIMAIKEVAKEHKLTIVSPHQVNRSGKFGEELEADQARESGSVEETADFVLSLWSPDSATTQRDKPRTGTLNMRILKTRHGGKGKQINLRFAPVSLAIVPHHDKFEKRALDEIHWLDEGIGRYEDVIAKHRDSQRRIVVP